MVLTLHQCHWLCGFRLRGDLYKRRSLTGYVFTLSGCANSWKVILQSTIALSTTKAEYMAVAEAVKEAIWLRDLVIDLGLEQKNLVVFCDSQSAIHLTKIKCFMKGPNTLMSDITSSKILCLRELFLLKKFLLLKIQRI